MSFDFSNELPENMHDVIKSAVDIVNDDFDYYKFMRAFSQNDPWNNPNGSLPTLSPQVSRRDTTMDNDALKSCPSFRQPVFTFEETSSPPKQTRYGNGSSQKANSNSGGKIKRADTEIMGHNNNPQTQKEPILKLQITGNPNYQLDESDILGIFSRYGNVQRIELGKYRTAFIVFDNGMNALTAQKLLNGQYMKHLDIKLYLSWTNAIEDDLLRPEETLQPNRNISPRNEYPTFNNNGNVAKSLPNIGSSIPSFPYNSAKYTCKYEIQIDNDKDFKIARKIIGPKGCNMKKIIEICQYHLKRSDIIFQSDFLKLRLRGRGSGFKEGPEQKESNDPLHLCVSSKYPEVYHLACKLVEDLLTGLYKEYETVCQRAGRPLQEPVQIKRIEIYNGSNDKKPEVSSMTSIPSEYNSQSHPGSLILNDNPDSSNSLGSLSDRECNNSPSRDNEAIVQLEESEAKSL